jgi:hypothetical protein
MVSAPLRCDWWVVHDTIVSHALAMLRLESPTDPDIAAVERAALAIEADIDAYLDRCTPLPATMPAPVVEAAVLATCNQYRRKDAPFGTTGGWSDTPQIPVHPDPLYGVRAMLDPYRERRGVA